MKPMGHSHKMCSGTSESVRATLPAEGKGRWDGVRRPDKEGAGSTELAGLERPEVGPAESRRHVTGDRNCSRGGGACL